MAQRPIVTGDVSQLRVVSQPVTEFGSDLRDLAEDLFDTLAEQRGLGLAAVQSGVPLRVFVIDDGTRPLALVNPEVVEQSGETSGYESCLSFPGVVLELKRPARIRLVARNLAGDRIDLEATGLRARIISHELDHLNGVLFMDGLTDEQLFEQLLSNTLLPSLEDDRDWGQAVVSGHGEASEGAAMETGAADEAETDLHLAADLLADATWKVALAEELLGTVAADGQRLGKPLKRARTALETATEALARRLTAPE